MHKNSIVILDCWSQVTQLIARRLRENGVYSFILPADANIDTIREHEPNGIIISWGPASVTDHKAPAVNQQVFCLKIPILWICYGLQLISHILWWKVSHSKNREYGSTTITITKKSVLRKNIGVKKTNVRMSHGDKVTIIPAWFTCIAKSKETPFVAIEDIDKKIRWVQFHPEVVHTPIGNTILYNFAIHIAQCTGKRNMQNYSKEIIHKIQKKVSKQKVLCGLSGGVDSTVAAKLMYQAIGEQLTCVFVNTWLLRKNEAQETIKQYKKIYKKQFVYIDASEQFLQALKNIDNPEKKRKIIGEQFIKVFEKYARKHPHQYLLQGTIYPDVIESWDNGNSQTIKSHHNVWWLPKRLKLKIIEPLRMLFKDEVRNLWIELWIPKNMLKKHPFPWPWLGIRIIGKITKKKITIAQKSDKIFIDELKKHKLYDTIRQAFTVLLPTKTVWVMGDWRSYEYVLALRAVTASDGMTADMAQLPYDFLQKVSNRITNEVKGVNRVVYDITSKPPATIERE